MIIDFKKPKKDDSNYYIDFYASSNNSNYDLFWLSDDVRKGMLTNNIKKNHKYFFYVVNAYYLYRYLLRKLPRNYDECSIVLLNIPDDNGSKDIENGYRIILEQIVGKVDDCEISICREDKSS